MGDLPAPSAPWHIAHFALNKLSPVSCALTDELSSIINPAAAAPNITFCMVFGLTGSSDVVSASILPQDLPRLLVAFQKAYLTDSVNRFPLKFRGAKMSCAATVPVVPTVGSSW